MASRLNAVGVFDVALWLGPLQTYGSWQAVPTRSMLMNFAFCRQSSFAFRGLAVQACVVFVVLSLSGNAVARTLEQVVFDSFGSDDSYSVGAGWAIIGVDGPPRIADLTPAMAFEPTASGVLSSVEMPIRHGQGFAGWVEDTRVLLFSDDQGLPGTSLGIVAELSEVSSWDGSFTSIPAPINLASQSEIFLEQGETYWLVAEAAAPTTSSVWSQNLTGDLGRALRHDGEWTYTLNTAAGAFRVFVAVPEPPTVLLMGAFIAMRAVLPNRSR